MIPNQHLNPDSTLTGPQGGDILSRVAAVNDALVGGGRAEPSRMNVSIRVSSVDCIEACDVCDVW